jgi:2-polyprenyl-3-methyl-5-hydroxy-6-metoxy-1,4-benzoquinol methylase
MEPSETDTFSDPIDARDIVKLFKRRHNVDVSRFFPSAKLSLTRVDPHGYYRFSPALPGDAEFYATLMRRQGYDADDKREFVKAAEFIASTAAVLDVGCGPGRFSRYCKGLYKGIELNPNAVAEGQKLGRDIRLEHLDDQRELHYDVVSLFQVLEHVVEPEIFLSRAALCVQPGGIIIVSTPDMDGPMGHAVNQELNYPPHHLTWWSADAMCSLLRAQGFEIVTVWREPLQRVHFHVLLKGLVNPRRQKHFDFSVKFYFKRAILSLVRHLIPSTWREIPFIGGHTVMVIARRPSDLRWSKT